MSPLRPNAANTAKCSKTLKQRETLLNLRSVIRHECTSTLVHIYHTYTDSSGPVVVKLRKFVGELLNVVRLDSGVVLDDVVGSKVDGPLPNALADDKEIVASSRGPSTPPPPTWLHPGRIEC